MTYQLVISVVNTGVVTTVTILAVLVVFLLLERISVKHIHKE